MRCALKRPTRSGQTIEWYHFRERGCRTAAWPGLHRLLNARPASLNPMEPELPFQRCSFLSLRLSGPPSTCPAVHLSSPPGKMFFLGGPHYDAHLFSILLTSVFWICWHDDSAFWQLAFPSLFISSLLLLLSCPLSLPSRLRSLFCSCTGTTPGSISRQFTHTLCYLETGDQNVPMARDSWWIEC